MMNKLSRTLLASMGLVALAGFSAQASALVIDHINLGSSNGVALQDTSAESIVTAANQTLTGVGQITKINGSAAYATPGYELNFTYTAHVAYDSGSIIVFDTGAMNFYVDKAGTFNTSPSSTVGSLANQITDIKNGSPFLNLALTTVPTGSPFNLDPSAPATGGLFGTGTDLSGTNPQGTGVAYFHVVTSGAGAANKNFNTDTLSYSPSSTSTISVPYDVLFSSSFSVPAPGSYASWVPLQDTSHFTADAVPEPSSLAIIGIGLLGLGVLSARSKRA